LGRPVITAVGLRPLVDGGMEVDYPYFDGDITTLVGEQLTQKSEITSVKVSLKRGSAPVKTYAGGSDVALQLIRRSSPSYRDAYVRIMAAGYAATTEAAFCAALVAGGVAGPAAAGTTPADIRAAIFAASVQVEDATGVPATVVAAASDVFIALGGAMESSAYQVSNVSGTSSAATLAVDVHGLRVVHGRFLAPGTCIVTNGSAAHWEEDGPYTITALDVPRLGEDTAVYGLGAALITNPAGVVKATGFPTLPLATTAKSSK